MSCLGVHFALTEKEAADLRAVRDEQARLHHVQEVIEANYFEQYPKFKAESDKSWDATHRVLADGQLSRVDASRMSMLYMLDQRQAAFGRV